MSGHLWKDQPDLQWHHAHDPESGESCLLIALGDRCGYTFAIGKSVPQTNDALPDIPLDQDLDSLRRSLGMSTKLKPPLAWLSMELLRRHINRKRDPFWEVEEAKP